MKNKRVIAVHLLNDFSGSPFVLRQSLEVLLQHGYDVNVFTATPSGKGFLNDINNVKSYDIFYSWNKNKLVTLIFFLYSQLSLFFRLIFFLKKQDVVYVNSMLPFGAALAGWVRGCSVIYHIHEVSVKPVLLRNFLLKVANLTACRGIFVSKDVCQRTAFSKPASVVYNTLPAEFITEAIQHSYKKDNPFTVAMICSLKKYKGVMEFVACASRLPMYRFTLVLNASKEAINNFFKNEKLPVNLDIFPAQKDVHPFYKNADVVVNLSLPDQWIETFGMTILEAMYYKKPVIIPNVGGITELVTDEKEGYVVNPKDIQEVCDQIQLMATCPSLYQKLSVNAFAKARQFTPHVFQQGIAAVFASVNTKEKGTTIKEAFQLPLF